MITLNLEAKNDSEKRIKEFLEKNASETLADKINKGVHIEKDGKTLINKKDLSGFMKYANGEAKKLATKGESGICVDDETVFGWAIHYFEEESIEGILFNEDGTPYKVAPKPATKTPQKIEKKPVKPTNTQFSFFDLAGDELEPKKEIEPSVEEKKQIETQLPCSPIYKKYLDLQKQYPDKVICLRLGDFYEVFGDNAKKISDLLDLTLTGRDVGMKERIPMIGFPYHAADIYFGKIVDKGLTLVICDNDEITEKSPNKYKIDYDTGEILEDEETPENADKVDNLEELTKTFDRNIVVFLYNLLDGKVNLG